MNKLGVLFYRNLCLFFSFYLIFANKINYYFIFLLFAFIQAQQHPPTPNLSQTPASTHHRMLFAGGIFICQVITYRAYHIHTRMKTLLLWLRHNIHPIRIPNLIPEAQYEQNQVKLFLNFAISIQLSPTYRPHCLQH